MDQTSVGRRTALGLVLAALSGCAPLPPAQPGVSSPAAPTHTPDVWQQRYAAAADLVSSAPGTLGIIVWDRVAATHWRAGATRHPTWTASTIKLAIVVGLLERARSGQIALDSTAHRQIADILDFSSDDAATALWNRYGRDTQVRRFQQKYGMTRLTFLDGFARFWGHMKCTAEDLLNLITYLLTELDPRDRSTIMDGMRRVGPIQRWGVWSAGPELRPGVKNGWSIEPDAGAKHWVTNTVGFAGSDARFAIAAMYDLPPAQKIHDGVRTVSDIIATIFGAPVPADVVVPDPSTGL